MIVFMKNLMTVVLAVALLFSPAVSDDEIASDNEVVYTELGIPLELHYEQTTSSVIPWDLEIYDEKLYIGAGDYDENTGPVYSMCFDIEQEEWLDVGVLRDEQISRFCQINGKLIAVGTDPMDDWSLGNYYVLGDDGWETVRSIPNGIHNFDMIEFDGKIFCALGVDEGYSPIVFSEDGQNFEPMVMQKDGENISTVGKSYTRVYDFLEFEKGLYAFYSYTENGERHIELYKYNAESKIFEFFSEVSDKLERLKISYDLIRAKVFFEGKAYISMGNLYCTEDMTGFEKIDIGERNAVCDLYLDGDKLYALIGSVNENGKYDISVCEIKNGDLVECFSFEYDSPPMSIAAHNGVCYIGIGNYARHSEKNGMVLSVIFPK